MSEIEVDTTDAVRLIALNRPETKNALTPEVVVGLTAAFDAATADAQVRAVLFTGRGGSFCSGADLKAAMQNPLATPESRSEGMRIFHGLLRSVRRCPKPVVGLVDGGAVGFGHDLALACDLRVATEGAYFQQKFVRIGLVPDGGGTYFLQRLVGAARAAELAMLGDKLEAEDALRLGVVNRLVPVADGMATARGLALRLAKGPPQALRLIKQLLDQNGAGTLDEALEREREAQLQCLAGPELVEGVMAFFQKREPSFPSS